MVPVPRKHPLPAREIQIGRRLSELRKKFSCPRSYMARGTGLDRAAIVRIELGRSPLKYKSARAILRFLNAHPVWVATGHGDAQPGVPMPLASELGIDENMAFSEVFDTQLSKLFLSVSDPTKLEKADSGLDASLRHSMIVVLTERLKQWFREVPSPHHVELMQLLVQLGDGFIAQHSSDDWKTIYVRRGQMDVLDAKSKPVHSSGEVLQKNLLTNVTVTDNITPVKSTMANLLGRLNKATSQRGMKSKLAKVMGVPLVNISQWLSGTREPGGETTLRLLHWVEQQERQQNTLGSATNTAKGKTQSGSSTVYEKTKSSPKKR
jgi:transcriptional regulator with XRE-family HTH domain